MKKITMMITLLLATIAWVGAQTCESGECSCVACVAKAAGNFTLPALQGLEQEATTEEHADCEHDPVEQDFQPAHPQHESHEGHGHSAEGQTGKSAPHKEHEGGGHRAEEEGGLELSAEMAGKVGIQIREAEGGSISKTVVFPAEIKLNRDHAAAVSPRYSSVVRQLFAEIGDTVKKGDVLAALENRETLAVYTVSAPLDGVIVSKDASVGESAGEERVLYEVADLSSVWVDISIFPQYRHLVRKGQRVILLASDGHQAATTIEYISPLVATETRTLQARCVLEGAAEDFTPGAFVRAEVAVQTKEAEVRIEKDAVQMLEGRPVVFIADGHGFEARDVELGLSDRSFVEIKAGLEHGEQYVAKGAFELKAEMVTSGLDPHAGHGH